MDRQQALRLAALVCAAAVGGCGGDGDGDGSAGFTETRSFEFTVTVPGTSTTLADVAFFRDEALAQPGVEVQSETQTLATPAASVTGQDVVPPAGADFGLAIHFDASGSIDDQFPPRDPDGLRFDAAGIAVAEVADRAPGTPTSFFTFRWNPSDARDADYTDDRFEQVGGIDGARNEGARGNSPALSATINIIRVALPPDRPHAMLLLTDGENNEEDPGEVAVRDCPDGEGDTTGGCSDDIDPVVEAATAGRDPVAIFVAGFGNNDQELAKFRDLADRTGGAFVKATRSEELESQFRNLAALMVDGGVVVSARTDPVEVVSGGSPFVRGWMRFRRPGAACPEPSVPHGTDFCKIEF